MSAEVFCNNPFRVLAHWKSKSFFLFRENHDLDRSKVEAIHIRRFYSFEKQDHVNELFTNNDIFPIIMRKFSNFNKLC